MIEHINLTLIAMQNMTITIGNTNCNLLHDSDSGFIILNKSFAMQIIFDCIQAQWSEKNPLELKSYSNIFVETLGTLKTPVKFNDWKIPKAKITVAADGTILA